MKNTKKKMPMKAMPKARGVSAVKRNGNNGAKGGGMGGGYGGAMGGGMKRR